MPKIIAEMGAGITIEFASKGFITKLYDPVEASQDSLHGRIANNHNLLKASDHCLDSHRKCPI